MFEKYEKAARVKAEAKKVEREEQERRRKERIEKKLKQEQERQETEAAAATSEDCKIVELTDEQADKLQAELDSKVCSTLIFLFITIRYGVDKNIL